MAGGTPEDDRNLFDLPEKEKTHSRVQVDAEVEVRGALKHKGVDPKTVDRICDKYAYEPLESLIKLRTTMIPLFKKVKGPDGTTSEEQVKDSFGNLVFVPLCGPEKAIAIDMELCKYKHSQKKSMEIKNTGPTGITVILSDVPPALVVVPRQDEKVSLPMADERQGENAQ